MSFADRIQRDLDEWERDLWNEHERGEHVFADGFPAEPACARCQREMREALNVEGDPSLNGAWG